jgi:hypothetical protein
MHASQEPEAESKEKHGVRDPMPELTITSLYFYSRVDTFTIWAPLCQSRLYPPDRDFRFGLRIAVVHIPNLIPGKQKKSRGDRKKPHDPSI